LWKISDVIVLFFTSFLSDRLCRFFIGYNSYQGGIIDEYAEME
jgi:hypothetical protein